MIERSPDLQYQVKFTCLDSLVPDDHLLRKIDCAINLNVIYEMVEYLYCKDNGRPAIDPVALVKIALIQRLYDIKLLRQT